MNAHIFKVGDVAWCPQHGLGVLRETRTGSLERYSLQMPAGSPGNSETYSKEGKRLLRDASRTLLTADEAIALGWCTRADVDALRPKRKIRYRQVICRRVGAGFGDPYSPTFYTTVEMYREVSDFSKRNFGSFVGWVEPGIEVEE